MAGIRLTVEQEVTINAGGHIFFQMFTLAEKYEQGVPAKEPNDQYRFITIDLNTIKFNPPATRAWNGI